MPFWGGGCLGALFAPIICFVLAIVLMIGLIGGGLTTLLRGGNVEYSENKMQDYASRQYATIYDPSSTTYEDNVLIVFLTNEDGQSYYCIGWVGDNLKSQVSDLFGDEYTALGSAMQSSINTSSYRYSLGSNLAQATEKLQASVEGKNLDTVYRAQKAESHEAGKVYNRSNSDIQFNTETVDAALKNFTDSTDISMSIVVADAKDVFGKSLNFAAILALLICIALIIYAVVAIVRYVKRRKGNADNWR
ncbi:MAG TPA: hypothetical protein DDW30_05815 [Clostridiales bacterium]|nr:hypothetical protein [Clostridiales bacterium]